VKLAFFIEAGLITIRPFFYLNLSLLLFDRSRCAHVVQRDFGVAPLCAHAVCGRHGESSLHDGLPF